LGKQFLFVATQISYRHSCSMYNPTKDTA